MGLRSPVMVIENHNCEDHAAGHHHHDAVEICTWKMSIKHKIFKEQGLSLAEMDLQ